MTRLLPDQINLIPATLSDYDNELTVKTGFNLAQIAACAAGPHAGLVSPSDCRVAVVPVDSGQGLISGFSEAVKAIACHLGFQGFITAASDVGGLAEAYRGSADLVMMADDHLFAVFNLLNQTVTDNDYATARGYATALDKMVGGLRGQPVLLIGAGRVGSHAAEALLDLEAELYLHDLNREAEVSLIRNLNKKDAGKIKTFTSFQKAMGACSIVFDASPGEAFITGEMVSEKHYFAAPGIPLGLNRAALQKVSGRLIHDLLQIGTATMLFRALVKSGGT